MRAITGAIVSSEPCTLKKAYLIIGDFYNSAASDLPSADCAVYLSTVTEAINDQYYYRRRLIRGTQQQGADNIEAHDYEGEVKHQDRERKEDIASSQSQRNSSAEVEPDVAAGEKKSKKKKNKEDRQQGGAVAGVESRIPSSTGTSREKKEKHPIKEIIISVKQEPDMVVDEELLNEKKSKKKKEKGRVKLEVEEGDVDEVGGKIVKDGGLHQSVDGGEKKRKKKKHEEKEPNYKDVKQEEKMVCDGDLDSEKKRKKKRGRGDNGDNAVEQVEHTKKKQRK
ncbi:unnamed protein product [Urochloa humidicola]